jgi:hypothetical protein
VFQHTLPERNVLLLVGEQWENYSCAHSMGKHVDECQQSDVLMDDCLRPLDQVGSRNRIVLGLCHQVTRIFIARNSCLLIVLLTMPTVVVLLM